MTTMVPLLVEMEDSGKAKITSPVCESEGTQVNVYLDSSVVNELKTRGWLDNLLNNSKSYYIVAPPIYNEGFSFKGINEEENFKWDISDTSSLGPKADTLPTLRGNLMKKTGVNEITLYK
jgi:hypothetical protein